MAYQPHHYPECCVGNIGRVFPNYAARMYWEDQEGVVCALYGDSEYTGRGLTLRQSGGYPFGETVAFAVSCAAPVETTIKLRIPGWCKAAALFFQRSGAAPARSKGLRPAESAVPGRRRHRAASAHGLCRP